MASSVKLTLSNREDFIRSFQALDENGEAIDLTGATIVFSIADKDTGSEELGASTADSTITISTTTATINIPVATVRSVTCPKEYNCGCTILLNSVTTQFFIGTVSIYDGIVP